MATHGVARVRGPRRARDPQRVWLATELFYPEETSTGHVMTSIAEAVAPHARVQVLCAPPNYSQRGKHVARREVHRGVAIHRLRSTAFAKDSVVGRLMNAATFSVFMLVTAVRKLRRGDVVLVVTNPPTLPFVALVAAHLRGARCALLVHDIHPDSAIATGLLSPSSPVARLTAVATRMLLRRMDSIITIGRDMSEVVAAKVGTAAVPITMIPNWADADSVAPEPKGGNALLRELGWTDRFVVQYSGNMGRPHAIEALVEAAVELQAHPRIRFLFVGTGVKRQWLEQEIARRKLRNVAVRWPLPRSEQSVVLNACDVAVIPLVPGMFGLGVPSRTYNSLAAGKPVIALSHPRSEIARLLEEEQLGWNVAEDQPAQLAAAILEAHDDAPGLAHMAARARTLATGALSSEAVLARFVTLLRGLGAPT